MEKVIKFTKIVYEINELSNKNHIIQSISKGIQSRGDGHGFKVATIEFNLQGMFSFKGVKVKKQENANFFLQIAVPFDFRRFPSKNSVFRRVFVSVKH